MNEDTIGKADMIISMQLCMKTVWVSLKKLKTELPYDPTIILLGIYSMERKTSQIDICPSMFTTALFTTAQLVARLGKNPPAMQKTRV